MATLYAYSPNGTQATLPVSVMGFTQSLATNGWCKLPNGLIFQWSQSSNSQGGGNYTTTYLPMEFPNIHIVCCRDVYGSGSGGVYFDGWGVNSKTTSSFYHRYPNSANQTWRNHYMSLGY